MDRDVIILNERAGTIVASSVEEVRAEVEAGFAAAGVALPEIATCAPEGLEERLSREVERGRERIIVGGGDGTVATAAGVLRGSETALGILPMGTFNLMARDLGMPLEVAAATEALATASVVPIDVAEVNGRPFLCVCVLGFFPEMALRRDRYRGLPWWRKAIAMTHAMLRSFTDYPSLVLGFDGDGVGMENTWLRTRFVAIANNAYEDEAGVIPRKRSLNEGRLAAYLSHHRSRSQLVRGSLAFVTGSLARDRLFELQLCRRLTIEPRRRRKLRVMLDGEILSLEPPLEFTIRPQHLRVLQPAERTDG